MDDAALVQEAVGGSVSAFTTIFQRYEPQVHDAALAMLRDRRGALAVTSTTFQEASERLEALQQPDRLRVWLLAITRFSAALVAGEQAGFDRQPAWSEGDAAQAQQAGLVWEATADLPLRERALLDLHLRQGLDGDDLADALGVSPGELAELKVAVEQIGKGLAGYLIMRRGDGRCRDLPLVLRGWDGRFTALVCTHIAAHVDSCRTCRESTAGLPPPLALYASAPQAPLPGAADGTGPAVEGPVPAPVEPAPVPGAAPPPDGPPVPTPVPPEAWSPPPPPPEAPAAAVAPPGPERWPAPEAQPPPPPPPSPPEAPTAAMAPPVADLPHPPGAPA